MTTFYAVYDEVECCFPDVYESQREAEDRADELNNDAYLNTTGTWYPRYSVDQVSAEFVDVEELPVHWQVA